MAVTRKLALAAAVAATLTGGAMAGAATPEYMTPVDGGGITVLGRTRNESCSVTSTFRSTDGREHTVTVNQTPKWGDPVVTVPAGGEVTVVVNGDLVDPYLVTVDGATVLERPVPTVTPGGHDCGPTPPTSTVVRVTPVPSTFVPQSTPTPSVPEVGGPVTSTSSPPVVEVPPATTSTTPAIELVADGPECGPGTLPCTGAKEATRVAFGLGVVLLLVGGGVVVVARRRDRR